MTTVKGGKRFTVGWPIFLACLEMLCDTRFATTTRHGANACGRFFVVKFIKKAPTVAEKGPWVAPRVFSYHCLFESCSCFLFRRPAVTPPCRPSCPSVPSLLRPFFGCRCFRPCFFHCHDRSRKIIVQCMQNLAT